MAFTASVLVLVVLLSPGIVLCQLKFERYTVTPARKLQGPLAPNTILNNAKNLQILEGEVQNVESISIRGDELFMGDKLGRILKIKDGVVSTIVDLQFPCDVVGENECSWPLGTRFDPASGKLITVDAYGGLLRVDVDTGKAEQLVARRQLIEGVPVGFPEDLDVAKDGTIYWSDGSTVSTIETAWNELLGNPTGRLLSFDQSTNKSAVLLPNIHLANGVQLSPNEDFVLVSESIRSRILRYYLKGDRKGQSDVFVDGLPGFVDNIRSNNNGGFYVSLFTTPQSPDLGPFPLTRKAIAGTINLLDDMTRKMYNSFPNAITLAIRRGLFSFAEVKVKKGNAFIVELSQSGEIIGSLQSKNGVLYGISQITVGETNSYFNSPGTSRLWYIENTQIPKN